MFLRLGPYLTVVLIPILSPLFDLYLADPVRYSIIQFMHIEILVDLMVFLQRSIWAPRTSSETSQLEGLYDLPSDSSGGTTQYLSREPSSTPPNDSRRVDSQFQPGLSDIPPSIM